MSLLTQKRIDKPWGHEIIWVHTDKYVGKLLYINEGASLSLQYHERKQESIYVLEGQIRVFIRNEHGGEEFVLEPGMSYHVHPGVIHRFRADKPSCLIEISTPEIDDVIRLEDDYGRQ